MDNNQFSGPIALRTSSILTTSFVACPVIGLEVGDRDQVELSSQLNLFVSFTKGSLTNVIIKVEFSLDGLNFFQESFEAISAGDSTVTAGQRLLVASADVMIPVEFKASFIRVSAKGTGTVTDSLLSITGLVATI